MSNFEEVQSQATEQALREQNQLLWKQLESMNTQMQAIVAQLQANKIPQSERVSQETLSNLEIANAEAVVLVEAAQQKDERATGHKVPYMDNYQSERHPQPSPTPENPIQAPQQRRAKVQRRNDLPILRYPPLPVSQTKIYKQLVEEGLISPMPAHPWVPPYPTWYNPSTQCAYHGGVPGHSTGSCFALRQRIYELINAGNIKLNLIGNQALRINEQPKINKATSNESIDDQEMEKNCWTRKQKGAIQAPSPMASLNFFQLPPLPVSQESIYKQLVAEGLLSPIPARPWNPPYPAWYDPNVKCIFHSNMAGHSIENCAKLRQKINELISAGIITLNPGEQQHLETKDQSGINEVAFKEGINIIKEGEDDQEAEEICWRGKQRKEIQAPSPVTILKRQVSQQKTPVQCQNPPVRRYHPLPVSQTEIFKQLIAEGLLKPVPTRSYTPPYPSWFDQNVKCAYHDNVMGHSTENCTTLRQQIHALIDAGKIKLNLVEQETLRTNDQSKINSMAFGEDINSVWQRKQREDMHVTVIRDDPASSNIWKIPQGEEGPRSYTVTPSTFPEI
jgi:hypothetical protein